MVEGGLLKSNETTAVLNKLASGDHLEKALLSGSSLSEEQMLRFLAEEFSYPYINLEEYSSTSAFLGRFPARLLLRHQIFPLNRDDGSILVATSRISDSTGIDELRLATGMDFSPALAPSTEIARCIKKFMGVGADTVQSMVSEAGDNGIQIIDQDLEDDMNLMEAAEGASIIRFVNQILSEAIQLRTTDVHIEPLENM